MEVFFLDSLKAPQMQIFRKCIDFLGFPKKKFATSISILILCSFKYYFSEKN